MRNENAFVIFVVVVILTILMLVTKFSASIGVDFETGLSILGRSLGVLAIAFAIVKSELVPFGMVVPAACSGLVWAFFPAIDFWALQVVGEFGFGWEIDEVPWWARWYSKAAYVLSPSVGGYGFRYYFSS